MTGTAVYATRGFDRWGKKNDIGVAMLCRAVDEMQAGLYDADLGGGLVKKRVARPGQGKSGGYRTLLATNKGDRWVFVFGFPKSARADIDKDEEAALKRLANHLLGLTPQGIAKAVSAEELKEIHCHAQDQV